MSLREARQRFGNFMRTGNPFEDLLRLLAYSCISNINHERYGKQAAFARLSPLLTDYPTGQRLNMLRSLGPGPCDGIEDERDANRFSHNRAQAWSAHDL